MAITSLLVSALAIVQVSTTDIKAPTNSSGMAPERTSNPLPRRGVLGVKLASVVPDEASKLGLVAGSGVEATGVDAGYTAAEAGIQKGDVIATLNGAPATVPMLAELTRKVASGTDIKFEVIRQGKKLSLQSKFIERKRDPGNENYSVIYSHIVSDGKRMRTIITVPKKPGKHPGFFFIQGFSPISYDYVLATADGGVPQLVGPMLHDYANSNFVTIRVEKPGVGDSEGGPFAPMDYVTELDIYRQTLKQLKDMSSVDTSNIFICGHSMGGAFGPMVASESQIKGIVTYGTAARTWFEYIMDTVRYQALVAGDSYENVDETSRQMARILAQIFIERRSTSEVKASIPQSAGLVDAFFPGGLFNGKSLDFWRQLNDINFPSYWKKANCYVLAARGVSDFVTYDADHSLIAEAVNQANPGYGSWVRIPNSDHLMHEFATEPQSMQNFQKGKFSMNFSNAMKAWILDTIKKPAPKPKG